MADLGIEFPAIIDDLENHTDEAYTGWPDRLYLIDKKGRLLFKSQPGPWGFEPEKLAEHLARLLPDIAAPVLGEDEDEVSGDGVEGDAPADEDGTTAAQSATDGKEAATSEK